MVITEYRKGTPFSIAGNQYFVKEYLITNSIGGKERYGELLRPCGSDRDYPLVKIGEITFPFVSDISYYRLESDIYILYITHLYPCFDWCDRACERRYYHTYILCSSLQEVQEKCRRLSEIHTDGDLNLPEEYRGYFSPYVYFDDGKDTFTVYD